MNHTASGGPAVASTAVDGPALDGTAIHCLITDDQAMVREGFAAVLTAQPGMAVAEQAVTSNGLEVLRKMLELSVSEQSEAQKKGPAAKSARAATR